MKTLRTVSLIIIMIFCILCLSSCNESMEQKYERAQKLLSEEKYFEAGALFDEISTYGDSSRMSMYTKAIAAAEDGQYSTAITSFKALDGFKDSSMMITYYTGRQYESQAGDGNWTSRITARPAPKPAAKRSMTKRSGWRESESSGRALRCWEPCPNTATVPC